MDEPNRNVRVLFEKTPLPMWVCDQNTLEILEVNDAALSAYGYARHEFLRTTVKDLVAAEDQDAFVAALTQLVNDQGSLAATKRYWRQCKQNRTTFVAELTWTPLSFLGRAAALVLVRDPPESMQTMLSVQKNEEWFRAILESSPIPLLITNPLDGQILYANNELGRMVGLPPQALVGQKTMDFYNDPADRAKLLAMLERDGVVRNHEVKVKRADGKTFWVIGSGCYLTVGSSRVILSGYYDITDRKEMEEENRTLQEQLLLAQKMEAVGRLAGGVAHDFNNLLTVINGYCEVLLLTSPPTTPYRQEIEQIRQAGKRAAALTQQLLAFSRHQVQMPQVFDLNPIVSNVGTMIQRLLGEDIELMTAVDPSPQFVRADPGQIEQVLMNLAVNARDAMPQGGKLTIETSQVDITESSKRSQTLTPGPYVMLSVTDTGCGMDAATKARIFEPFFTTKEVGKGTGLGLSTVYGIVNQNGGAITVYSEPGYGSTFRLYLPQVSKEADTFTMETRLQELPRGQERVLVVEDEPGVRSLVVKTLRRHGYTVLEARHGFEGLIVAGQYPEPIHLLMTDVVMPQMSGGELATRLLQSRPGLKILYMSGYSESGVVHQGLLNPGTAFLQKPFDLEGLMQKVREVLDVPKG
jgi:PAS domain S-box-containing protein